MNFNHTTGAKYLICQDIFQNGPLTADQAIALLPQQNSKGVRDTMGRMATAGDLVRDGDKFSLEMTILHHFKRKHSVACEAAAPRTSTWKPLSFANMGWMQHKDKLRDISFVNLSGEFRQLGEPA